LAVHDFHPVGTDLRPLSSGLAVRQGCQLLNEFTVDPDALTGMGDDAAGTLENDLLGHGIVRGAGHAEGAVAMPGG